MRFTDWDVKGFDRPAAVKMVKNGLNPLIAVFFASRGITSAEEVRSFLSDDIGVICDPFLLEGMDAAVDRIRKAMRAGERIAIYGDYDVDGMTASCLLASFFRARDVACEIYIPDRLDEGYGLNCQALDSLHSRGVALVITVDCGITAVFEAEHARSIGLDLIITDHHEYKGQIPNAVAVIDPKRQGCSYPNRSLAGVGVAFKLVCALEDSLDTGALLEQYGDLVAIGTVADVMPVVGENRALIRHGLAAMNKNPRPGVKRLIEEGCADRKAIDAAGIGFRLAPRLNAAGRMGRTSLSVELLLTEDEGAAAALTSELCSLNDQRRQLEMGIFEEAVAGLERVPAESPVVLAGRGWHQGVMGIVAAKIAEQVMVPAVMISLGSDGMGRGSCRSFGTFKMYSALKSCEDLLQNYGGHEMAAGLTICESNIAEFRRRITEYYRENVKGGYRPALNVDFEVEKPELLSIANVEVLESSGPFGSMYLPPCLCIRGALLGSITPVGGGKHVKLTVLKNKKSFDCIFFGHTAEDLGLTEGQEADIAFEPIVNEFRLRRSVQLHIIDIRAC